MFIKRKKYNDLLKSRMFIGKNKELYTGTYEQRQFLKSNIAKHSIYTSIDGWETHSISFGVNHPAYNEVKEIADKYKDK